MRQILLNPCPLTKLVLSGTVTSETKLELKKQLVLALLLDDGIDVTEEDEDADDETGGRELDVDGGGNWAVVGETIMEIAERSLELPLALNARTPITCAPAVAFHV